MRGLVRLPADSSSMTAALMTRARRAAVRGAGRLSARWMRWRAPAVDRPGVTVVTVNWNSRRYLEGLVAAVRATSPPGTRILVVDNASSDGSREALRASGEVESVLLPVNFGHGVALDIGMSRVRTEYAAVLDVDSFPISEDWLPQSLGALARGAKVTGARMHRNYVHPCFLVTRTALVRELRLSFVPVGSLARRETAAPLFLDVGEALSQRMLIKFGGGGALHLFPVTSVRGPGGAGAVYGDLVYHNQFATQGAHRDVAFELWREAFAEYHPGLRSGLTRTGCEPC